VHTASQSPVPTPSPDHRHFAFTSTRENPQTLSDDLVRRCQRGDRHALGELFDRYAPELFAYFARQRAGDRGEAEALTTAALTAAFRRLPSYERRRAPLTGWMYRIAQELLAGQRQAGYALVGGRASQQEWFAPGIERLTLQQRSILILRVLQSLSVADTSYALRLSDAQVKRGLREALQALRDGPPNPRPSREPNSRFDLNDRVAVK
jgi:DNA-directed RNA polymerase specialized sigma24 family protein